MLASRPRRALRWLAYALAMLLGVPLLALGGVVLALNLPAGRAAVETLAPRLSGGMVVLHGLAGRFPDALRIGQIRVADAGGAWLTIEDLRLDWSPRRLLAGALRIDLLSATRVTLARLPVATPAAPAASTKGAGFTLPLAVALRRLRVETLDLGADVAGVAARFSLDGEARLASLTEGDATLGLHRLDGAGQYRLAFRLDAATVQAQLGLAEPGGGLLASLAHLPNLGALAARAALAGPRGAAKLHLTLDAGPLHLGADGLIDLPGRAADLTLAADAPAMTPAPGLGWASLSLAARLHGPLDRPQASGRLRLAGLSADGAAIDAVDADLAGSLGEVSLAAHADRLTLPGPAPGLLAAAPLALQARLRLDAPGRPLDLTLTHPLLALHAHAITTPAIAAHLTLALPDLAPLAAIGGLDLRGDARFSAQAAIAGATRRLTLDGQIAANGGAALHVSAQGSDGPQGVALDWHLALPDLSPLAPRLAGHLDASGHLAGPPDAIAGEAAIGGDLALAGQRAAPLDVALTASRGADATLHLALTRAAWRSVQASGVASLAAASPLPRGHLALRLGRLDDLAPLLGAPLAGALSLDADFADALRLRLEAHNAGLPGRAMLGHAALTASLAAPLTERRLQADLTVEAITAGALHGNAKLSLNGPPAALALRLSGVAHGLGSDDLRLRAGADLDALARRLRLTTLEAAWRTARLRLLAPSRLDFADGVRIDRLALGLDQARLTLAGRLSPTLDTSLSLRGLRADLLHRLRPDLAADGVVQADARLTGPPATPSGTVQLSALGLHLRHGPAAALPPADLRAHATLNGVMAALAATLDAGAGTRLSLAGRVPESAAGLLALHAGGSLDLALANPVLTAEGRSVQGHLALDASLAGSIDAPRLGGQITLTQGEIQDFTQSVRLAAITARLSGAGDTLRLDSFSASAPPGRITAQGSVGVFVPGLPIDLTVTARNARPIASDLLTALLDADLRLHGTASRLAASGVVHIQRAEIGIPATLPASVAVLHVIRAGAPPAPPPTPAPPVALDLALDAPQGIFVHGRGLNVELGGRLHIGGTAAAPRPDGGFEMRRGQVSLGTTSLNFSSGRITFAGGSGVPGAPAIDPALHFLATSSNGSFTATLLIAGFASAPTISLTSVPEQPQDQILGQLMFGQNPASLSPFQLAAIGIALAQLSGATASAGDPLNSLRQTLGLDRLSIGTPTNPLPSPTGAANAGTAYANTPTLEAGRYVAPGVYVGAKQGATGTNDSQAVVQIDIARGLKLETQAGTGLGANSVGFTYQLQY